MPPEDRSVADRGEVRKTLLGLGTALPRLLPVSSASPSSLQLPLSLKCPVCQPRIGLCSLKCPDFILLSVHLAETSDPEKGGGGGGQH